MVCFIDSVQAQGSAGNAALYESQRIVDMPTAGVLPSGGVLFRIIAFDQGGLLGEVLLSPLPRLQLGIGYSGIRVVSSEPIQWQGIPAIQLRWRFIDETLRYPAVAIGFETLGRGRLENHSFSTPAPGAYLTTSKQFRWLLGGCSVHAGVGLSFDLRFNSRAANSWVGFEQSVGSRLALSGEINPMSIEGRHSVLTNLAVRWSVLRGGTLEVYLRDIFTYYNSQPLRWIGIELIGAVSQVLW